MEVRFRVHFDIENLQFFPEGLEVEITPEFCAMFKVEPKKLTNEKGQMHKIIGIASDGPILDDGIVWVMPLTAVLVSRLLVSTHASAQRKMAEELMPRVRNFRDGMDFDLIHPLLIPHLGPLEDWEI